LLVAKFREYDAARTQNIIDDLQKDKLNPQQEALLKAIDDLNQQELEDRRGLVKDERDNNLALTTGIEQSLKKFIDDLRTLLLEQQRAATENRANAVAAQQAETKKQLDLFKIVTNAGGGTNNAANKTVLDLFNKLQKLDDITKNIDRREVEGIDKFTKNIGGRTGFVDPTKAAFAGTNTLRDVLTSAGIENVVPFLDKFQNEIALARDESSNRNAISRDNILVDFASILKEGLDKAAEDRKLRKEGLLKERGALGEGEQKFFDNLSQLNGNELAKVNNAILMLGNLKLDELQNKFNDLNTEAKNLADNLRILNDSIKNVGKPQPQAAGGPNGILNALSIPNFDLIMQGITDTFTSFITSANPIAQAMKSFPSSVEMRGTHTVNVNINGAQAMSQMQPAIEALIQSEIGKALTNYTLQNLPGALSYSQ
jgi:23S rRNA pseudoU1915 N3-methylase RlmH